MAKNKKRLEDSVVIVCEGTESEPPYFSELSEYVMTNLPGRFGEILVVPTPEPVKDPKGNRKKRTLKGGNRYHIQGDTPENYELYKAQPTRYVREAYLFKQNGAYNVAWAVFDKEGHPDHKNAFGLAEKWNVGIAFSSYCFEEWLLLHFERNEKGFQKGECHEGKGLKCSEGCDNDCNGEICIAGRLRAKGYIPGYRKDTKSLFENYTKKLIRTAFVNAAWSRRNTSKEPFLQNPYCSVDKLVGYLIDESNDYVWLCDKDNIPISGHYVRLEKDKEGNLCFVNKGNSEIFLSSEIELWDEHYNKVCNLPKSQLLVPFAVYEIILPGRVKYIMIPDKRKRFIIEL